MTTRVFVVGAWDAVLEWHGVLAATGDDEPQELAWPGFAVTDALRAALPGLDEEELEHYAMTDAAQASLGSFSDEGEPMRRLVIAVDTDAVTPGFPDPAGWPALDREHPGLVTATFGFPHDVAAWMVDTEDAAEDVRRASAAYRLEREDAAEVAQKCLRHELAWFTSGETETVMQLP
ncbi:hypothetical protein HN031_01960 [Nocardioides sp. zg-1308]|uniref:DUF6912 family protein n=1 Tax=Nocardioides sp. zg-1308 TaxID=2736253 RepID=UPI0015516D0D|nr:hypothetical protein [Nocardioides sp. zg-1308]NPD03447.1 hypothetical protein [Nocardioides sp. zg-1308]